MKKVFIKSILFIAIGFVLGEVIFGDFQKAIRQFKNTDTYYFLQEGTYSTKTDLERNIHHLNQKIIDKENNQYYVYVGITKDKEIAERIRNIYAKRGYPIHYREKSFSSAEFSENVNQFDLLIRETEEEEQILTIEAVVLANYEEIKKK